MESNGTTYEHSGFNRINSLINRPMILRILGVLLWVESLMFLICAGVSIAYAEQDFLCFVYSAVVTVALGGVLSFMGRKAENRLTR